MNEFLLVFRRDYKTAEIQPSPEKMQEHISRWQEFFAGINDKLARPVQRFDPRGKIITDDKSVADGPYAEVTQSIGGLAIIKAADYDEALAIVQTCPILELGGTVELRQGI
jgi:hypothetical protein